MTAADYVVGAGGGRLRQPGGGGGGGSDLAGDQRAGRGLATVAAALVIGLALPFTRTRSGRAAATSGAGDGRQRGGLNPRPTTGHQTSVRRSRSVRQRRRTAAASGRCAPRRRRRSQPLRQLTRSRASIERISAATEASTAPSFPHHGSRVDKAALPEVLAHRAGPVAEPELAGRPLGHVPVPVPRSCRRG